MSGFIKQVYIVFVCFTALVLLPGCTSEQTQKATADTTVNEQPKKAEPQQVEQPEAQDASPAENAEVKQKLVFARSRFSLAQKGIMGYSQTVVLCRDVIRESPDTSYEQQARELLRQVPKNLRPQFNITDEELEL